MESYEDSQSALERHASRSAHLRSGEFAGSEEAEAAAELMRQELQQLDDEFRSGRRAAVHDAVGRVERMKRELDPDDTEKFDLLCTVVAELNSLR